MNTAPSTEAAALERLKHHVPVGVDPDDTLATRAARTHRYAVVASLLFLAIALGGITYVLTVPASNTYAVPALVGALAACGLAAAHLLAREEVLACASRALRPADAETLEQVAALVQQHPDIRPIVQGWIDRTGSLREGDAQAVLSVAPELSIAHAHRHLQRALSGTANPRPSGHRAATCARCEQT